MPHLTSAVATPSRAPEIQLDPQGMERLRGLVRDHADALVKAFYDVLLEDREAQGFLHHSIVQERLSPSLRTWLIDLFAPGLDVEGKSFIARQTKIGEVHARIKIPMHLVMAGAAVLKGRIADLLADDEARFDQLRLVGERIDAALLLMSQSYVKGTMNRARMDEAYRLFSLDQDIHFERESQRASLMEWSQKTLFRILGAGPNEATSALGRSPFGLWIRHRADFLFEASPHLERLNQAIDRIDEDLLPRIDAGDRAESLTALQAGVEEIAFLLNEMFQGLAGLEGGRDPLTRTLNRRFLSSILSREIGFANANQTPLSVLLLDVDHFKRINDEHGHPAGDEVLRQVAEAVTENVRPSDFVFRYGGEEFLIVLVETTLQQAVAVAERTRQALEARDIKIGGAERLRVTASIGAAEHGGHPDENYLIKTADEALYRAKQAGRNRVEQNG
ncbi:diguanylate cyclase [Brevundimonas naejangsanensis]|uniref:Diguanylate cyclase DosC n=1 Tax=Brevundimonas naejangsanensis TaxID=588932 RepID=A0A494RL04_9CAUL|nr:diguanylate cyclase [Brevundimonas naejangsanensis]AYG94494.1 diguanylate cyclase [Brevundimonas naejangsanensis]